MDGQKKRIVVLVSGGGSNLQAIIDRVWDGAIPNAEIACVISSKPDAYALTRAEQAGIKGVVVSAADYPNQEDRTKALLDALRAAQPDLIVLAGYMRVLEPAVIEQYAGRIINIHPSLIPKYCGKGFYGERVHQAVLAGGETVSGATVHFVDEGIDTGDIILQRQVPVEEGDDAASLAARVLTVEHQILPEAIRIIFEKSTRLEGEKKILKNER